MNGPTNASSSASAKGFIRTTYPEGSICTCSNGARTLEARDTSGYMMFILPTIGIWIVTATDPADPTNTDSETVEITKEGETVSVDLSYRTYLYKNGVFGAGQGELVESSAYGTQSLSYNSEEIEVSLGYNSYVYAYFPVPINTNNISTLRLVFKSDSNYSADSNDYTFAMRFQINTNTTWGERAARVSQPNLAAGQEYTLDLDVSSVDLNEAYVFLLISGNKGSWTGKITEVSYL